MDSDAKLTRIHPDKYILRRVRGQSEFCYPILLSEVNAPRPNIGCEQAIHPGIKSRHAPPITPTSSHGTHSAA